MAMYRLLDRVSPADGDCGRFCGAACCNYAGTDFGIYLYPGEEKLFEDEIHRSSESGWLSWSVEDAEDYEFPLSWRGKVYFASCTGPAFCVRHMRPLQCRFFPLAPHLTKDGTLHLILYPGELPYRCPLLAPDFPLDERFVRATYTVWKRLIQDPLIRDLVAQDSKERQEINLVCRGKPI